MPEVHFTLRWPDGTEERCYSPSTAIKRQFDVGETYALAEFLARARAGLTEASDRVAAKYGFACTAAMGQLARIEARGREFEARDGASVVCVAIEG
ncbi:MSMEG_0570 family nitrogen starvation response protein [Jiella sp. MQZ9-1]|uniref:MSMEG_0570 family nitrogen starvation response protein n=1 Tax=Jiella flava TaxID=2816857 RepID=A0A939FXU6_9HYPH|nr:MSMEG_0570 family nitrogen starvation response protein [Jiella flava]MBO0662874.1 MSMEG_0570 family nitrogen starvation response protein [Jiella flava]MCD2471366.1 MSMEG_0570 family nitrogen starvation response protein [Jiella flava]